MGVRLTYVGDTLRNALSIHNSSKDEKQILLSFSKGSKGSALSNWVFDKVFCREELAKILIIDELSFSSVDKEGFQRFVRAVQPRFQFVSLTTITKDCLEICILEKTKLKSIF